jgi:hypothetical protein
MPPAATLPSAKDAAAKLASFQQPDSASVLSQAQQKYGIQGLQDRVNTYKTLTGNLTGAIAAVDPSVTGRTSGTLTTEGQRSALVARERAPIVGQLGTAQTGLEGATNDYNTADKNARSEADATIADNKTKYDQLMQTYTMANDREQQQAKAAADAAAQAENVRQFNVSQAAAASRGGAAAKVSPADVKMQVSQHVAQGLAGSVGKDGKVSNETWSAALNDAVSAGFTVREFWQKYGQFVNTKYKSSYAGFGQR